jgi:SAM-dependent methyltransferase
MCKQNGWQECDDNHTPTYNEKLPNEIVAHYEQGDEIQRLSSSLGQLEETRMRELIARHLPATPAVVYDVGGGPGGYACWLAKQGYEVHLVDPVPLHVEQAAAASQAQPDHPIAELRVGDARHLDRAEDSVDVVLMLGPLYHLTERNERIAALQESYRILRRGGIIFAVAISRYASTLHGMIDGNMDPDFIKIASRDLREGQHRNPNEHPAYFTTAYLHRPEEFKSEIEAVGFDLEGLFGIQGPGWLLQNLEEQWDNPNYRERLLNIARSLESEPSVIGVSAHIMAIARKTEDAA